MTHLVGEPLLSLVPVRLRRSPLYLPLHFHLTTLRSDLRLLRYRPFSCSLLQPVGPSKKLVLSPASDVERECVSQGRHRQKQFPEILQVRKSYIG